MAKKNIDITNLEEKLTTLTGIDLEEAISDEIRAGNTTPREKIFADRSFLIRLAAKALGVKPADLKNQPVKDYFYISEYTAIFLTNSLPTLKDLTDSDSSEELPST